MFKNETRDMKELFKFRAIILLILCFAFPFFAAAGTVTYTYDQASRLTGVNYANGKVIRYTYDNMGNILRLIEGSEPGDVNADASIDLGDAIVAMKLTCRLDPGLSFVGGDANGDDRIDLTEVIFVLRHLGGFLNDTVPTD